MLCIIKDKVRDNDYDKCITQLQGLAQKGYIIRIL